MRQLFELCGADRAVRFSPYAWRARLMLMHKGLDFETIPLMFTEKEPIAPAGATTLPVLRDGDTWVKDSFDIACYLDQTYPEKPLFGSLQAMGQARLLNDWFNRLLGMGLVTMLVADIHTILDAKNRAYFRETREKRFGMRLEDVQAGREGQVAEFQKSLAPLRATLSVQPFFSGDAPAWTDYAIFGNFMWARVVSPFELLAPDDIIDAWRVRMLDLFDGHARRAPLGY